MTEKAKIKHRGVWIPKISLKWRHHSGRVYRIVLITNLETQRPDEYPVTVVYANVENGTVWSRPASDWDRSFTPCKEQDDETD